MTRKIVLTGGGTAGHVTPNIALIHVLQPEGWQIDYIGSVDGVEKGMIKAMDIPYHGIHSGKLRRYFSWKNFIDPLKILLGIIQAYWVLHRLKPEVVFSKGGFVAFPVVVGAWLHRIPIIAHESDMTPGLANRLSFPFATKIALTFEAAKKHIKDQAKVVVTGTPIRQALLEGQKDKGLALCGFSDDKPCLLIVGGSQGANALNACVRQSLSFLCEHYQLIHLCGRGKVDPSLENRPDYCQFDYVTEELPHLLAASELVVSRAGANALYELLVLQKPHVLIPLSAQVSRGDQVQNARYFEQQGISVVIREEALTQETLLAAINDVEQRRATILESLKKLNLSSGTTAVIALIKSTIDKATKI